MFKTSVFYRWVDVQEHDKAITMLRLEFERECHELQNVYEERMKVCMCYCYFSVSIPVLFHFNVIVLIMRCGSLC